MIANKTPEKFTSLLGIINLQSKITEGKKKGYHKEGDEIKHKLWKDKTEYAEEKE
jgi:hypothetical protein